MRTILPNPYQPSGTSCSLPNISCLISASYLCLLPRVFNPPPRRAAPAARALPRVPIPGSRVPLSGHRHPSAITAHPSSRLSAGVRAAPQTPTFPPLPRREERSACCRELFWLTDVWCIRKKTSLWSYQESRELWALRVCMGSVLSQGRFRRLSVTEGSRGCVYVSPPGG